MLTFYKICHNIWERVLNTATSFTESRSGNSRFHGQWFQNFVHTIVRLLCP